MKKLLLPFGIGVIIGAGLYVYIKKQKNQTTQQKTQKISSVEQLNEKLIKQYLQKLKDSLFDSQQQISQFVGQIKTQLQNVPQKDINHTVSEEIQIDGVKIFTEQVFYPNQNKINVAKCEPIIQKIQASLRQAQQKCFEELNFDQKQEFIIGLESKINEYSENNEEIKQLKLDIRKQFDQALKGEQQEIQCEIPENLTPQKFLQIMKEIMKQSCYKVQRTFKENESLNHLNGEIQAKDAQVQKILAELDFFEIKQAVLKQFDMDISSEKIEIVLKSAEEQFKKSDNQFSQQIKRLYNVYDFTYEACIYQSDNVELVESFFQRFQI